jgi:hypothetical protein
MEILVTKKINATKEEVWHLVADYANIHRFHPLLKTSGFIEGSCTHEPGATRQCDMLDGSFLKERITDWKEGSHYSVEVYETSMPVKDSHATIGITALNSSTSLAYMFITMKAKYLFLKPLLYLVFQFYAGPAILRGLSKAVRREQKVTSKNLQTSIISS